MLLQKLGFRIGTDLNLLQGSRIPLDTSMECRISGLKKPEIKKNRKCSVSDNPCSDLSWCHSVRIPVSELLNEYLYSNCNILL